MTATAPAVPRPRAVKQNSAAPSNLSRCSRNLCGAPTSILISLAYQEATFPVAARIGQCRCFTAIDRLARVSASGDNHATFQAVGLTDLEQSLDNSGVSWDQFWEDAI